MCAWMSLFLRHTPITRPAACGRSCRTSSSSGSSARRGGLEEARLVNLARQSSVFPVLWQAIPDGAVVKRCRCACPELFFMLCLARYVSPAVFPFLRDGDVEQHQSELSGSFASQLNTCYNTHGHVSVFWIALLLCLVHSCLLMR